MQIRCSIWCAGSSALPYVLVWTLLTALNSIHNIAELCIWVLCPWDEPHFESVTGCVVHRDVIFIENPSKVLQHWSHIWNDFPLLVVPSFGHGLFFVVLFADLIKAALGKPHGFWLFSWCVCSFSFPSVLQGMFSAVWLKDLITQNLCSSEWWESKSGYWSVCIGFQYTSISRLLPHPAEQQIPKLSFY